ncbi:MAG: hypothetical protein Q8P02_00425, partial [Candidatus Micrarchaeota archaeon]|nr:hypothetical protein [Candidatus Micrarchaeota archaeon]
ASLDALVAKITPLAVGYFNSSAGAVQEEPGRFVIHEKTREFEFSVVVAGASRHWVKDDTLRNFTSADGVTNGALVFEGNTLKQNGFLLGGSQLTPRYYGYFATMKCFGQKYEVQLHLVDYLEITPDIFRQDLGPKAMNVLVSACPA